jgi:hypothetical protein
MGDGRRTFRLEDLPALFGIEPPVAVGSRSPGDAFSAGDWFCVAHELVIERNGEAFAIKEAGGDGRRILLGNAHGPNASVYTRSAKVPDGLPHDEHSHRATVFTCKLDLSGWVRLTRRVSMGMQHLNEQTYSCTEPADSPLLAQLKKAQRL